MINTDYNSVNYWNNRFATDWKARGGVEQSTFFSNLVLQYLPAWFKQIANHKQYKLCDWGCALGDGTEHLKRGLNLNTVTGVDFSEVAIQQATITYPDITFVAADFTKQLPVEQYDVLFTSNTLEHFRNPWNIIRNLSGISRSHIVILVPFKEYVRFEEHYYTFDFHNIPTVLENGFMISHAIVIDTQSLEKSYWSGKQILLTYSDPKELRQESITLNSLYIESALISEHTSEQLAADLNKKQVEVEYLYQTDRESKELNLQRDKLFSELKDSVAVKDQYILSLENTLAEKEHSLVKLKDQLQENNIAADSIEIKNNELVNQLQDELLTLLKDSSHFRQREAELENSLNEERSTVYDLKNQLAASSRSRDYYSQAYFDLSNSRSWRYTSYLRLPFYYSRQLLNSLQSIGITSTLKKVIERTTARRENISSFKLKLKEDPGSNVKQSQKKTIPENLSKTNTAKKIKICILVEEFNEGGVERVAYDLAQCLRSPEYDTYIGVAARGGKIEKEALKAGIDVFVFDNNQDKLNGFIEHTHPDVILTNHCYFGLAAFNQSGAIIIEIFHNAYFWQKQQHFLLKLREKHISHFISVSEYVKNFSVEYLGIARDKVTVINNGLNIQGFIRPTRSLRIKIRNENRPYTFFITASIRPSKGHHTAIEAFRIVLKEYPDAVLQFAGGVDDEQLYYSLLEKTNKYNLENSIQFLGSLDRRELSKRLMQAHAAILPSSYEGFSIASLEYMFFGIPIILTDVGAAREIISNNDIGMVISSPLEISRLDTKGIEKYGYESDLSRINELAEAMKQMIKDKEIWMEKGELGCEKIDNFLIENVIERYTNIIRSVLS